MQVAWRGVIERVALELRRAGLGRGDRPRSAVGRVTIAPRSMGFESGMRIGAETGEG